MRDTLKALSTDRNWLRSGTVSMRHEQLLKTVASFSRHPSLLKTLLSEEGMEVVAKFYASRKMNDTPSRSVAPLILRFVNNALSVLQQGGVSDENEFGILEKSGLLGQFIRCVPVDPECSAPVVTCLQACVQLVKKKLKSGIPTGDIFDAVIAGEDGPIKEKAKADLVRLQSLARLSNDESLWIKGCHHCEKVETLLDGAKLMKCQGCKAVYYCSKECQVADWKKHKKWCKTVSCSELKTFQNTMTAFIESNYFHIAKEVDQKTQEYNVPKKELFVEVHFYGDAPALRNEFKVWLTSDFVEGSWRDRPSQSHLTGSAHISSKIFVKTLRENYERVTSDRLLAGNGMVAVQSLHIMIVTNASANAGCELLSDEAVESIGTEDYVRMVACLGRPVTNMYFEKRNGLT
jgi:hypothetical protein